MAFKLHVYALILALAGFTSGPVQSQLLPGNWPACQAGMQQLDAAMDEMMRVIQTAPPEDLSFDLVDHLADAAGELVDGVEHYCGTRAFETVGLTRATLGSIHSGIAITRWSRAP